MTRTPTLPPLSRWLAGALLLLASAAALAAPTAQVFGGSTRVVLSDAFVGALGALGVTPAPITPGRLYRGRVAYPIPGGALDLATARGDVFHVGGLSLTAGGTSVSLYNFIIDTQGAPVLTGLVAVNGDVVGRIPLFDLNLRSAPRVTRWNGLIIRNVEVTLNATAATALNDVFNVGAFVEGFDIGTATLRTRVFLPDAEDGDDDEDDH